MYFIQSLKLLLKECLLNVEEKIRRVAPGSSVAFNRFLANFSNIIVIKIIPLLIERIHALSKKIVRSQPNES